MTNPEYVNPGIVQTDEDRQKAFDAQQEVAARDPRTAVPDIITNAEAEQAAANAKEEAVAGVKRTTAAKPKADTSK